MDVISKSILPMLDKLAADDIPNIRFNVAKTYGAIIDILRKLPEEGTIYSLEKSGAAGQQPSPKGMELIQQQIVPNLEKLQKDDDVDVRYFATSAIQRVDGQADAEAMNTSP